MGQDLGAKLLAMKTDDYRLSATQMPANVRLLSKIFAKTLGASSGKLLRGYETMFEHLQAGHDVPTTLKAVERVIDTESKVTVKLPFYKGQARLCGLVALNQSGFIESEVALYAQLLSEISSVDQLEKVDGEKYAPLLANKQRAIYDFSILMGMHDDELRFAELKEDMHPKYADYFTKVAAAHRGNFGLSWPLPFKKFISGIEAGLYADTVSHMLQQGRDYGFTNPHNHKTTYDLMVQQIRETTKGVKESDSWAKKLKVARTLPAAAFFLAGVDAYASNGNPPTSDEMFAAATTASTTASSCADPEKDGVGWVSCWFTTFTTILKL